ncbi:hypothetical protein RHSIM_Rhsim02G0143600 [Rhododendron simsii]|uniref:Protein kinase domain-containing protein n=1 Tax=Rhododendron simsii TaxID=118357 RepID=A0A834HBH2_RHOSS|nr:hypothetical protein RHSIM_Rhsim02G0143600 [Rhododendron simsii]
MGFRWNTNGVHLSCLAILILIFGTRGCWSLNSEGLALLEFRARVDYDPYGAFANWNRIDNDPCLWPGVYCVNGKVEKLDLNGLSLEGKLATDLGKLSYVRYIVLYNNHFSGAIPKEIGGLTKLEVLDLRNNSLSGTIPAEFRRLQSLKRLLICNNSFEGKIPLELRKLNLLSKLEFDERLSFTMNTRIGCVNRKFGYCIWQSSLKQLKRTDSFRIRIKVILQRYRNFLTWFKSGKDSLHTPAYSCCNNLPGAGETHVVQNVENLVTIVRRRLLQQSCNLNAAPAALGGSLPEQIIGLPTNRSSGSFPAVPNAKKSQFHQPGRSSTDPSPQHNHNASNPNNLPINQKPSSGGTSWNTWKYIVLIASVSVLLIVAVAMLLVCRKRAVSTVGPWKTGLSGQLQKAFVTGVPKLNRQELENACEDFSNILDNRGGCIVYKGILSSGVEIAVASTVISSTKDWTKRSELAYRKKIDTLSRVNHKNFVNLIGYCEEDEPFTRMMVFEYVPNGSVFEHLHVKEVENLDWNARMRIVMGSAYCLQYMHDLNPPVAHSNLVSRAIFVTDDNAAKIVEIDFWAELALKSKISGENESEHSELRPSSDPETNVYSFGVLLLEIISGKLPYSEEQGPLVSWMNRLVVLSIVSWIVSRKQAIMISQAAEYLKDKRSITYLIDPALESVKNNELDIIRELIHDCIHQDPRKRPTMKQVTSRLREVIDISPEAATPRLSPLWWAELEILSAEAS